MTALTTLTTLTNLTNAHVAPRQFLPLAFVGGEASRISSISLALARPPARGEQEPGCADR
jgi:hypothetical protein